MCISACILYIWLFHSNLGTLHCTQTLCKPSSTTQCIRNSATSSTEGVTQTHPHTHIYLYTRPEKSKIKRQATAAPAMPPRTRDTHCVKIDTHHISHSIQQAHPSTLHSSNSLPHCNTVSTVTPAPWCTLDTRFLLQGPCVNCTRTVPELPATLTFLWHTALPWSACPKTEIAAVLRHPDTVVFPGVWVFSSTRAPHTLPCIAAVVDVQRALAFDRDGVHACPCCVAYRPHSTLIRIVSALFRQVSDAFFCYEERPTVIEKTEERTFIRLIDPQLYSTQQGTYLHLHSFKHTPSQIVLLATLVAPWTRS